MTGGNRRARLVAVQDDAEAFVIGGEQLYRAALPLADRLYLTEVDLAPGADAFFPEVDPADWQEEGRRECPASTPHCAFVTYARRR